MADFSKRIMDVRGEPLRACSVDVLQANMGFLCNMSCKHCHVNGGPERSKSMQADTVDAGHADNVVDVVDWRMADPLTDGGEFSGPRGGGKPLMREALEIGPHVIRRGRDRAAPLACEKEAMDKSIDEIQGMEEGECREKL